MTEFELIRRYFSGLTCTRQGVALGIGDDAALLSPSAGCQLVVTSDTLVAGRHFPEATAAADIGWKALAVNLSDLAAMGAEPRWFTLALTLPVADESWLQAFACGLAELAAISDIALVGGDTTRGALSLTITAIGEVPAGTALRRDGARDGDLVCVTGTLGDAAAALRQIGSGGTALSDSLRRRLDRPSPRLAAGLALRGLAHAAIDVSDGLAGDLQHILDASGVGAELDVDALPASTELIDAFPDRAARRQMQLTGGDDYELCVCLPEGRLQAARARLDVPLTVIGRVDRLPDLRFRSADGVTIALDRNAYQHFP